MCFPPKVEYNPSVAILNEIHHRGHREIIHANRQIIPGPLAIWLERAVLAALILFAIAAPISIAAMQTAWLLGMLFWVLRFSVLQRTKSYLTALGYVMLAFFCLIVICVLF